MTEDETTGWHHRLNGHAAAATAAPKLLQSCPTLCELWSAARQAFLSITDSRSLLKFMSTELVLPSNHLIPFSSFQFFPASGSFPISQFFTSGGQSIGASASASVLPMNIQD